MQLKTGTQFRQRDGGVAYVATEIPEKYRTWKGEMFIGVNSEGLAMRWFADGSHGDEGASGSDLIEELTEPLELWVNVYPNGDTVSHRTKEHAEDACGDDGRTVHMREVTE